jgi:hypothetical protein
MLTFAQFLEATRWGDAQRTYEQGIRFDGMQRQQGSAAARV